jgi:hypothetical protein
MKKSIFILLILSGLFYSLYSQPKPEWRNYIALAGRSIAVDPFRDGVMWIAGSGGLSRFDSHSDSWQSYTTAEGFSKPWGRSVFVDKEYIWVGTESGGANLFDIKNERFTPFLQFSVSPHNPDIRPTVNVIYPEEDIIWVGTNNGFFAVDAATLDTLRTFTMVDGLGENYIYSIADDGEYLWLATAFGGAYTQHPPPTGGLTRFNKSTYEIKNFRVADQPYANSFVSVVDEGEYLLVAGGRNLLLFSKKHEKFFPVFKDIIRSPHTVIADDEDIWCIGRSEDANHYLFRIERVTGRMKESVPLPQNISRGRIAADESAIYLMQDNYIYVSSKESPEFKRVHTGNHFLPGQFCYAVNGDNNRLSAGSDDSIVLIDKFGESIINAWNIPVSNGTIRGMTLEGDNLWVGTNNGLHLFDIRDFVFKKSYLSSERVHFTVIDDQYVWASSHLGLYRIDKSTGQKTNKRLSPELNTFGEPRISDIVLDGDVVWLSYSGQESGAWLITGIVKLDRTTLATLVKSKYDIADYTEAIETIIDRGNYFLASGKQISKISKDNLTIEPFIDQKVGKMVLSESNLWAIERSQGVKLFDIETGNEILSLNESNGLLHDRVTDIFVSDQYASFSTYAGVSILRLPGITDVPGDTRDIGVPTTIRLQQNYPNPFNPSTKIEFSIPLAARVRLIVYDALGRRITTLADRYMEAGFYSETFDAGNLPSGVYFYRLDAGGMSKVSKMMYVR